MFKLSIAFGLGLVIGYAYYSFTLDYFRHEEAIQRIKAEEEYCPRPFRLVIELNGFTEKQIDAALEDVTNSLRESSFPYKDVLGYGLATGEVMVPSTWWRFHVKCLNAKPKVDASAAQMYGLVAPELAKIGKSIDLQTGIVK